MESLLNETQVAEVLQVSLACMRRWRLMGQGPEYRKVGPLVRYRREDLERWIESQPSGGNGHRIEDARYPVSRSSTLRRSAKGHGRLEAKSAA